MITWTNTTATLGQLKPWALNPRLSTKAQAKRLLKSWHDLGQFQTIAVSPEWDVYDGHQRLSALLTVHGPEHCVDVRQSDRKLTDEEHRELVVMAHIGAVGSWDWDKLSAWDAPQLREWGMDADALKALNLDALNLKEMLEADKPAPVEDVEPQVDRAEELRVKWGVESGQLWQLGDHRLICGDCTDRAVVERVMDVERAEMVTTDPPYGVSVGDKNKFLNSIAPSNRVEENLENDTLSEDGILAMLRGAFDNAIEHCTAGAAWYVAAPAVQLHLLFGQVLKERGIWRQTIQWVKNNATFSPMGVSYHWQCEPIFYGWLPNGAHRWHGGRKETTAWFIDRPQSSPEHPTMKPVELVERTISHSSLSGEIVYDPFSGSGTTLIACERLGRKCRAIEIDPGYVAVALERWATATGKTPELLNG